MLRHYPKRGLAYPLGVFYFLLLYDVQPND